MTKLLSLATLLLITITTQAAESSRTFTIAAGASVPDSDERWDIKKVSVIPGGPISRRSGGEVFALAFMRADTDKEYNVRIDKVRLIGYSKSGHGKVLVHLAQTKPRSPVEKFLPLANYSAIDHDAQAENYKGLVMLNDGDSVVVSPHDVSASRFLVILEAFGDDDASVAIQLTLSGDVDKLGFGTLRMLVADAPGNRPPRRPRSRGDSSPSIPSNPPADDHHDSGENDRKKEKDPSTFCTFHPNSPGCPTYCQFHPMDERCTHEGSTRCTFQPNTPGCPNYCQFHPMDEHCTQEGSTRCTFQPMTPGCPTYCQFHPMDEHCTH